MATNPFTDVLKNTISPSTAQENSRTWLREQAQTVRQVNNPRNLLQGNDRLVTNIGIGRMYLFMYDPKTKEDLPYFDRFPLIFPFRKVTGGFYGINMHYLPHMLRAKLMDALYTVANNRNNDDTTKLRLSYQILESTSKFRYFKPCVKHYLNSHVKSRFLWVPAEQWDTALFLPLERFVGANKQQVWRDSRRMVQQ
jgi:hypothetical protein